MIEIVGLRGIDEVAQGDNLVDLLKTSLDRQHLIVRTGDIIVVTSKIVSKAEGRFVRLDAQSPSPEAVRLAELTLKDPRLGEIVLRESISGTRGAKCTDYAPPVGVRDGGVSEISCEGLHTAI